MTNKNYCTNLPGYNEAEALQQLLQAASSALDKQCKSFEAGIDSDEEFTITVNGVQTAFYLGGPQFDALIKFIKSIAAENFYSVDVDKHTVVE